MSSQRYISDTLKQKKQKIIKIKIYIALGLCIALLGGLVYVLRLPAFHIQEIKTSGNTFVDTSEIEQKAQTLIDQNILGIIPSKNIFLFSKKTLQTELLKNPAIISVKIRKDFFHTLSIEINEQEKEMIYCTSIDKIDCYYINKTGFIYAKVEDILIPEQEVIIYSEQGIKKIQDTLLKEEQYVGIVLFVKNVTRQGIKIREVYIKADSVIEFVTQDNTRLIASLFDVFEKDFANLIALFEKEVLTQDQLPTVEYIDLRFGNKVFYKNKTN